MPQRRSYNQYCSVARALDLVGDRWTLLLVRELMIGPRRYTDLLGGLPGIGTNHLADRLKRLVSTGVVRRRDLPPPAASTVYELTARGRGLEPVVIALAHWGGQLLGEPSSDLAWRPEWTVIALRGRFDPTAARGLTVAYQFEVEGQPFWARVRDSALETGLGHIDHPTVTVTADRDSFTRVAAGSLSTAEAEAAGTYTISGDREALRRAAEIFPTSGAKSTAGEPS